MNLELNDLQHNHVERARLVVTSHVDSGQQPRDGYDHLLWKKLIDAELLGSAASPHSDLLFGVLLAEVVSRANGMVPAAVQSLLSPMMAGVNFGDMIAPVRADKNVPVRYGAQAKWWLLIGDETSNLVRAASAQPVNANYGYPLANVNVAHADVIDQVPAASCSSVLTTSRWRMAIAAETVGAMEGALNCVSSYLSQREQFGIKLGSLQAIHHRLAEHAVSLESVRWLVRQAAWLDCAAAAATAAGMAARAARALCGDAHQLCGARGFTREFGLERWTLRLQFLSMEAGGAQVHEQDAASLLWN